tara:strand:+ start:1364 stop:1897 length:534 start_codon:yes stop_codon:yes gene_type:complete
MRLIKAQTTNLRSIAGKGVRYDINDNIIMDGSKGMIVPKGTTVERPLFPKKGMIRFNTDTENFETYAGSGTGTWEKMKRVIPGNIVQQNLGNGDDSELIFGPLANGDLDYPVPAAAANVMVFVENVFQLSTINYTLVQSSSGNLAGPGAPYADGWYIKFGTPVPSTKPVTVIHNYDK